MYIYNIYMYICIYVYIYIYIRTRRMLCIVYTWDLGNVPGFLLVALLLLARPLFSALWSCPCPSGVRFLISEVPL